MKKTLLGLALCLLAGNAYAGTDGDLTVTGTADIGFKYGVISILPEGQQDYMVCNMAKGVTYKVGDKITAEYVVDTNKICTVTQIVKNDGKGSGKTAVDSSKNKKVSIAEFTQADGKKSVVIDIRQPKEYQASHLPYAVNIPLPALSAEKLKALYPADTKIYIHCNTGNRVKLAVHELQKKMDNVYGLDGEVLCKDGACSVIPHQKK